MNHITKIKTTIGINWKKNKLIHSIFPKAYEYCCYKFKMSNLYINEVEVEVEV